MTTASARDHERELDLVLLGATGFTGGLVAHDLARRIVDQPTRWAVAGRDRARLEALAERLADHAGSASAPEVRVVDVHDETALDALAASTRVLVTTVGPYVRHGFAVAAACAHHGTDYADITGEADFVSRLRDELDATARASGARLVNCCGFDSVPHDLGARHAAALLPQDTPIALDGYVRATGGMSGGTAASALTAITGTGSPRRPRHARRTSGGTGGVQRGDGGLAVVRDVSARPARLHRVAGLDGWGVPLPTIDAAIVRRSARVLPGYGTAFRYGHHALVRHLATVALAGTALGAIAGLGRLGPTRRLVEALLPAPGEGPDEHRRAAGRFRVTFLGRAGDAQVVTRVSGGDPGYGETSRMLAEAALALVHDGLPEVAGVVTPAVGLGEGYRARLEARGMRFEVLSAPA